MVPKGATGDEGRRPTVLAPGTWLTFYLLFIQSLTSRMPSLPCVFVSDADEGQRRLLEAASFASSVGHLEAAARAASAAEHAATLARGYRGQRRAQRGGE